MTICPAADPIAQIEILAAIVKAPSILTRLRLETRNEHEAVEQVLDLMAASLTREGYRRRLEQFYGFYAPLEKALLLRGKDKSTQSLPPSTGSALVSRLNKSALLKKDLHRLGIATRDLPLCPALPPQHTHADILGALYVMEGATLGGRLITQHIRATLGITPNTGGSFFEGYGYNTGKMWQTMRQLLVNGASDASTENAIVTNAITTFASLRRWCQLSPQRTQTETTRHA